MKKFLLATAFTMALSTNAKAYDQSAVVLGIGSNNVFDNTDNNVGFEGEIRFSKYSPASVFGLDGFSPYINLNFDNDSAAFAGAGFLYDAKLGNGFSLVPQFGAGLYRSGDGRKLGGAFNFRSAIEVNYALTPTSRVGLQLMHLSHTSLLYNKNPGTENLILNYQFGL